MGLWSVNVWGGTVEGQNDVGACDTQQCMSVGYWCRNRNIFMVLWIKTDCCRFKCCYQPVCTPIKLIWYSLPWSLHLSSCQSIVSVAYKYSTYALPISLYCNFYDSLYPHYISSPAYLGFGLFFFSLLVFPLIRLSVAFSILLFLYTEILFKWFFLKFSWLWW